METWERDQAAVFREATRSLIFMARSGAVRIYFCATAGIELRQE